MLAHQFLWLFAISVALFCIVCATFCIALAQYALLYWLLVPRIHIDKPVFFDFDARSSHIAPTVAPSASLLPPSVAIATSAAAGRPLASVSLLGPQWTHTAATADVYPTAAASLLASQQAYRLELQLHVPDSPFNRALGMVQVNMEFLSVDMEVLAASSRSVPFNFFLVQSMLEASYRTL